MPVNSLKPPSLAAVVDRLTTRDSLIVSAVLLTIHEEDSIITRYLNDHRRAAVRPVLPATSQSNGNKLNDDDNEYNSGP